MIDENPIRTRFQAVRPSLDERGRRLHVAAEAIAAGHGGVAAASRATKVARSTIGRPGMMPEGVAHPIWTLPRPITTIACAVKLRLMVTMAIDRGLDRPNLSP